MAHVVVMPRQGNTVESSVLARWTVAEGTPVAADQVVCEVETDKATFEVHAGAAGVLLKALVAAGDDVRVLAPIAVVGAPGEDWRGALPAAGTPPAASDGSAKAPAAEAPAAEARGARRARLSPRARRIAREAGLDAAALAGSGPGGRVLERDVRAALERRSPSTAPAAPGAGEYAEAPLRGLRKAIAERMRASLASTAQLTFHGSAPAERLLALRARFKAAESTLGLGGVTLGHLVLYAVARVLPRFPAANAHLVGGALRTFSRVHLGVAVDTPRGLMVPVIRDADRLPLAALSAEARRLAAACVARTVRPDELAGATFTVSNLGAYGVESFTPVLDPPQVAILGVSAVAPRAAEGPDGRLALERRLGLSLTVDHQALDGAPAARLLQAFAEAVGDIDLLWTR